MTVKLVVDEPRTDWRTGIFRRLTLLDPTERPFLDRWGIDAHLFGIYLHRIVAPDPGLDVHDHPWPFATLILRGGYIEEIAETRRPAWRSRRAWKAGQVHRMPLTVAHRITHVEPGTLTLVFRGRKLRRWGFYQAGRWVDYERYDYAARRPVSEIRR